ncbi:MAG: TRAP transporter substrate-binding protein [Bacillota bacterium]|nr:TRAP transporter substrate-binding protein [Bacillota bacterium]
MVWKKAALVLLMVTLAVVALASSAFAADKVYTIKFAYVSPELTWYDNYQTNYITTFKGYVERASQGRIKVESYPAAQLGAERETIEGARMGTIEMISVADAPLSGFFKESMVLSIPGIFSSIEEANDIFEGPWGRAFNERLRKALGLRVLSHYSYGFRHFTNSKRPLRVPEDAKGLKFRVMESPVPIKMVESLSATATPMPASEMYSAMQQGVVDGQENPITAIIQDRTHEVQKYLVLDGHTCSGQFVLMNDRFFTSLPADLQKIVEQGAFRARMSASGLIYVKEEAGLQFLKKYLEIYQPTPEEAARWRAAVSKAPMAYVRQQLGDKPVDDLLKAIQAYRKAKK